MFPKGMGSGIQILLIVWGPISNWQPCAAAPEPKPQWLGSLYGGTSLAPTGENLWKEAEKGNLETVKDLVARGIDINHGGGMPLWYAINEGHIDIVKYLLSAGANPDGDDSDFHKGNIIAQAAKGNNLEIIDLLIAAGASLVTDKYGINILSGASENGHIEAVRKLIQAGVDVNFDEGYALIKAAENGHLEVVKEFIKAGVDVNARRGWILDSTARSGQTEAMKLLIEAGATKKNLDFAMKVAAIHGNFETLKLLFDNGADPNYAGTLREAARSGNLEIVKLLLDAGAQITYNDKTGIPLHLAAAKGHIDIVSLLVSHGGDINRRLDKDIWSDLIAGYSFYGNGWTVMHVIARYGYPYVKELLDLGADINAKDALGNTPLQVAVIFKKVMMAKEFLRFCIDASVVNKEGNTALALAMKVTRENSTSNEMLQKLMVIIKGAIPDKLASTPDNAEGLETLTEEFSVLVNTSSALRDQLENITSDRYDIRGAIYYIFLEESMRELPKTVEDNYCKPSMQREHKVSIGIEYLAKCECVPGDGPTMTYTPFQERTQCQHAASTQTDDPPQESASPSA